MRYSVLDLCPIIEGGDAALAFRNSADLAQRTEKWGYFRYWLAEHHNMPGIGSAATSVVIAYIAGKTEIIRVGAGGVMLPNHAPLVIAEQFGTLESLYPGRIDLALGRAPGSDQATARALRRRLGGSGDTFTEDLVELMNYFRGGDQRVRAVPGSGLKVPVYLLGSSDFSARLAAELSLPFAFASHFAPDYLQVALDLYRREFKPSATLQMPYVIIGIGLYAAESDDEGRRVFSSAQLQGLSLIRGRPGKLPPPVDNIGERWSREEHAALAQRTQFAAVGSPEAVRHRIEEWLEQTAADEMIAISQIYDHGARLRSYEIGSRAFQQINATRR